MQYDEGKLEELLKDVAESSPGPDAPAPPSDEPSSSRSSPTGATGIFHMWCNHSV